MASSMLRNFVGLKGGQIFHEILRSKGVEYIFGYPGGTALPLLDGIYKSDFLHFIVSRHEQGAGHMAEGYAQACGKPGVVLVTSGPGTSNMVTPMFDALLDGIPLIVICGQVATSSVGTDAFQEIDVVSLAKTCTKWSTAVDAVEDIPMAIETSFLEAMEGRPGPVLVAIPRDVSSSTFDFMALERAKARFFDPEPAGTVMPLQQRSFCVSHDSFRRVANMINAAERPVIIAGHGVIQSSKGIALLESLSERGQIPVATTLLGLGCFDETKDEALHMVGTYGAVYANYAVQNADLILALGARLDERVVSNPETFAPSARLDKEGRGGVVYFGIDPRSIGKLVEPTEIIQGDLSESLPELLKHLQKRMRPKWLKQIQSWKKDNPFPPSAQDSKTLLTPAQVLRELNQQIDTLSPSRAILCTGVGQHQMWTARCYRWQKSSSLIASGGLGTMGFGLPASIGARLASPDSLVIDIDGDGSFCMTMEELMTASSQGINVKVIIFNNREQRMITQLQQTYYGGRVTHADLQNPDFVMLAESMRCEARRCTQLEELSRCIDWLLHAKLPAVLDVDIDDEPPFFPFVSKGAPLDKFIVE